ncbi:MAG TPA: carboxylesterase/lipase family protein [Candidatus Paceibacterota bacterium]|nr:carboxylesterase/lipase family protein [Verrucomicrobiota bacterium]HRY47369.1 carboxylesterase/lipase family protein [Candidatus Paceibacterota bacterium]
MGSAQERVTIANGILEGTSNTGIRVFKGIPFAAPPVGDLRWRPPQPPGNWSGVRKADKFGPRAMQRPIFGDMNFRSDGMSEDCLYLNVWTPATSGREKLPVLVYFYGGGFVAGDGSEPRYDGESMARKGIVAVTVNYRLGVFGFFAHPELTQESPQRASGNYGLLDQHAALEWVRQNIAAFGGNPKRVTIAGESAGSISVSAQMASPLSKGLIAGAIGESGSILGALSAVPLAEGEQSGIRFAATLGRDDAPSLAALRALSADKLLEATAQPGIPWFRPTVDGYFFPKDPADIYAAGEQARVPLLAGSNSEEMGYAAILGREKPTVENYRQALQRLYPGKANEVFTLYPAANETEVMDAARDLAGDRFISHSTWKWIDLSTKTGRRPTYYYLYARPRPPMRPEMGNAVPGLAGGVKRDPESVASQQPQPRGAVHSAEIEYALGNLDSNKVYAWTPDDYAVSRVMQEYFANFIKTGNPNGPALPRWSKFSRGQRLILDVHTRAERQNVRARYEFLDQFK